MAKSIGASDILYGRADCLFSNKPAQKAFIRFCGQKVSGKVENSVSFVITVDAGMIENIMSIESTFFDVSSYIDDKTLQFKKIVDLNSKKILK